MARCQRCGGRFWLRDADGERRCMACGRSTTPRPWEPPRIGARDIEVRPWSVSPPGVMFVTASEAGDDATEDDG